MGLRGFDHDLCSHLIRPSAGKGGGGAYPFALALGGSHSGSFYWLRYCKFLGGFGIIDVLFGSAATLAAAVMTSRMPNRYLAAVPPVVVNAIVVGGYLSVLLEIPLLLTMIYVGVGQVVACFGLGIPLLSLMERRFRDGGC